MKCIKILQVIILLTFPTIIFAQKTEHVIHYWDSVKNIKKEEGNLINGKKNGEWVHWHKNGQKESEEVFEIGDILKRTTWYENGNIEEEAIYEWVNKKKTGLVCAPRISYKDNESIVSPNWDCKRTVLKKSTFWYENGQKELETHYRKNKIVKEIDYYGNGKKSEETQYKNDEVVKEMMWYENGQKETEKKYKKGKLVKETYWDEDGKIEK